MNKRYLFLGLSIISFAVILVSAFTLLLWEEEEITTPNNFLFSKYISNQGDDLATSETTQPQQELEEDVINPEKQNDLVLDESRKVLQFQTDLTEEEKASIEEKYDVEFTQDQTTNGVYTVITTEESNVEELQNEDNLKALEVDVPVKMSADTVDWGITRIGADSVWDKGSGSGSVVAVVDTGVQLTHSDLANNITNGYDFVNNDNSANDDNGHGTHVAGIVAATSNSSGSVGASHTAQLMPIKVLNSVGSGYVSDVAKGIYWAADNGANIINLSLGTATDSIVLKDSVDYATNKGVIIVAAAGNDSGAPCQYPAAYSNVICVVATDSSNRLASFSNIGGEFAAPGVSNYSTFVNSTYKTLSGTSMASPHIAGSFALAKSVCTDCSVTELRNALRETAVDLGDTGKDIIFGYGLVDLISAVDLLAPQEEEEVVEEEPAVEEPPEEEIPAETPEEEQEEETEDNVRYDKQTLEIVEPQKEDRTRGRYTVESDKDFKIKFKLDPLSSNSGLDRIEVSVNNEVVYTTQQQEDEFEIEPKELDGVQQFVKVIAYFKDGHRSGEQIVLEVEQIEYQSKFPFNAIRRGRGVLGISTTFSLKNLLGF